ncbi:hypothetical protein HOU03_gp355 [Caulobacter phage CcrSC]|uniref:Uncharacterized protein n=1 Tax=Caulobacter phage CcrSC TaxID=2283272 RepID=A0A385EDR8_9CAUD|nr:hypothetical protein HOU03_gp355 [Caulobacter phage CcrSC]AXQ69913.1 hypothetical protein CcrSC_gp331 [Caulobacter phage CcrSC]
MRAFIWQGGDVLRNYRSGLVVVLAPDEPAAWEKLRQQNLAAFVQLLTGHKFSLDEPGDLDFYWGDLDEDEKVKPGYPILPQVYDVGAAPVAVCWGGD